MRGSLRSGQQLSADCSATEQPADTWLTGGYIHRTFQPACAVAAAIAEFWFMQQALPWRHIFDLAEPADFTTKLVRAPVHITVFGMCLVCHILGRYVIDLER